MQAHHTALIYVTVLMSAADQSMAETEIETISDDVVHWPVFKDCDTGRISEAAESCLKLLTEEDGLDEALREIAAKLPPQLHETAYALACDVAAADGMATQEELRLLEMLGETLGLGRLETAAIERATRARHMTL
jgi:tellurite resistance protein